MRISQQVLRFSTEWRKPNTPSRATSLLDLTGIGRDQTDAHAVAQLRQLDGLQHLREQPPGIEGEDVDVGAGFGDGMQDRLILELKAGGEHDAAFDPPPHLPDAVGEALDAGETLVELARLLARGVPAQRQKIAIRPAGNCA